MILGRLSVLSDEISDDFRDALDWLTDSTALTLAGLHKLLAPMAVPQDPFA